MVRHGIKPKRHAKRSRLYRKSRKLLSGFAALVFLLTVTMPVFAEENYANASGEKLAEGVKDSATGWVEIPKQMAETTEESNPIAGVTVGTIKGAGEAVVKTTEGAVKAATFYIPEEQKQEKPEAPAESK